MLPVEQTIFSRRKKENGPQGAAFFFLLYESFST
jgi:hypothetical protein